VAGFDVVRDPRQVRYRIGLVGQNASLDKILSGRESLVMFGRLVRLSAAAARRRAEELLEQFDLAAAANQPVADYSGGMRRRLDLAASLILSPPVTHHRSRSQGSHRRVVLNQSHCSEVARPCC